MKINLFFFHLSRLITLNTREEKVKDARVVCVVINILLFYTLGSFFISMPFSAT